MQYRYQQPHEKLSDYVKTVLIAEGIASEADNKVPLFTQGMPGLICRTLKLPSGVEDVVELTLFGKSAPPDNWDLNKNETTIAYFFKPFSVACLFDLSAAALAKKPVEFSRWNAIKTNALKTQLAYAGTSEQKVEALNNLLLHQLQEQKRECEIVRLTTDKIMNNPGTGILSDLLAELKLNERTFQRIFKKYVGVTPNFYRRVCHFQISFENVRKGEFDKLTDIAYKTGFSDQSHFIRSFKEFTEVTPKDYKKSGLKRKKT